MKVDLPDARFDSEGQCSERHAGGPVKRHGAGEDFADAVQCGDIHSAFSVLGTVSRADGDGEKVYGGFRSELGDSVVTQEYIGLGVVEVGDSDFAFHAGSVLTGQSGSGGGQTDIFRIGEGRSVKHDGCAAAIKRSFNDFYVWCVIQVDGDWDGSLFRGGDCRSYKKIRPRRSHNLGIDREGYGLPCFFSSFGYGMENVRSRNSEAPYCAVVVEVR